MISGLFDERQCMTVDGYVAGLYLWREFHAKFTDIKQFYRRAQILVVFMDCLQFPKALLPRASKNLGYWVIDWVRRFSPCASSAMEAAQETKIGTKVA